MIFAPHIMARFPVKQLAAGTYFDRKADATIPLFHFKGKLSELMPLLRDAFIPEVTQHDNCNIPRWVHLTKGETFKGMLDTCKCPTALAEFMAEESKLKAPLMRDRPMASIVGASFSMGRVMSGHPVQCYRRPKHKLPPKTVNLSVSVSSGADAKAVSKSMAKIVHAAHDYHLAGGAVTLVIHYLLGFHKPNPETGAQGIAFSLEIPLGDGNLAAFSGSVQFFRAIMIPYARALSGQRKDTLTVLSFHDKSIAQISGFVTDAEKQIADLKIS